MMGVVVGCILGILLGTVSGLVPGIHSNTFAGFLAGMSGPMLIFLGTEGLAAAIVSAMVVHTFLDAVPSTFLGVPDPDTVLAALPAHRLCLAGHGAEAIRISGLGSLGGFVISLPLALLFILLLPQFQEFIDWGIGLVILSAAGLLIVYSRAPTWALLIFIVSGVLGVFSMAYSHFSFGVFGVGEVLLPLLTGLFGVPVLLTSIHSAKKIPEQKFDGILLSPKKIFLNCLRGSVAGSIVGWFPGFSSGTANALLVLGKNFEKSDAREYLVATSSANTANAILCLAALYAIGRMRSGSMVALAEIDVPPLTFLLLICGIASVAAYLLTIAASYISPWFMRINQPLLAKLVLMFLIAVSLILCGPYGLAILFLATLVGMVPTLVDVPRIFCMGVIMVPVMLFSLDLLTL